MAIFLALMSSVVWGTSDFIGGLLSRRLPARFVVAASQAAGLAVVTIAALASRGFGAGGDWPMWAVLAGACLALGLIAFYVALATGTMGIVSAITALGVLVPVAVGLLRGETPSAVTGTGVALALVGAVAASGPELRRGSGRTGSKPIALAGLAGASFGASMVFLARGAEASPLMTLWGMRATHVAVMVVFILVVGLPWRFTLRRVDATLVVLAGAGAATANLLFSLASLRGYLSVVSALACLYPVTTVLLARFLLQERLLPMQVLGVGAALSGVVLVTLG